MSKLSASDLDSLEKYSLIRNEFRQQVMAHKKNRRVTIGEHATLYFEDTMTIRYQVQEMLRIEKIFEADGIQEELDVYNPLIPDGSNWKATFMLEYADENERKAALSKLRGIDKHIWVQVDDCEKVRPIANEDLERETEDKTSSVHFMRFELDKQMVEKAKAGAPISMGIDHPEYQATIDAIDEDVRASLVSDLA
jgi:hypothetical protein